MSDPGALVRQQRRLNLLKEHGVQRSTVFCHRDCMETLTSLRPYLLDPSKAAQLKILLEHLQEGQIPRQPTKHLSLFRYPGGKSWLYPVVREWLQQDARPVTLFVEPFAGGASTGLAVAAERLAKAVVLSEYDEDVAAVWSLVFHSDADTLMQFRLLIKDFVINQQSVRNCFEQATPTLLARAFLTLLKNRVNRGGIMADGAGQLKKGEAGRGLASRWYPATLVQRIDALQKLRDRISFVHADAFDVIQRFSQDPGARFFIDPPYTAGGKKAGSRLYTHHSLDHDKLFRTLAQAAGAVMMTYDDTPEVHELARKYGFHVRTVKMKSTHHKFLEELLITKSTIP